MRAIGDGEIACGVGGYRCAGNGSDSSVHLTAPPNAVPAASKRWKKTLLLACQTITKLPSATIVTAGSVSVPAFVRFASRSVASFAVPLALKRRKKMPALSPGHCPPRRSRSRRW